MEIPVEKLQHDPEMSSLIGEYEASPFIVPPRILLTVYKVDNVDL
jgi:hypothetical protein